MNGVKYSKNGGIIKATINSNEMKKLRLVWAGVKLSKKEALRKQSQLVECFENENWNMVSVSEDFPSSLQTSRVSPSDIARFNLPEGETKVCVVLLKVLNLTEETQNRLIAFGEEMKNTMGVEFRVVMWN